MKTIIAGSRSIRSYGYLLNAISSSGFKITKVISGGAKGADKLGELYANRKSIPLEIVEADWELYGKRAGMIRNSQMAERADALIAIWDGTSSGTKHMIKVAKEKGLKVYVLYIEQHNVHYNTH